MVGGRDFTLMGRPVLPRDLAQVTATIVEKNISKTNVHLVKQKKLMEAKTYCEWSYKFSVQSRFALSGSALSYSVQIGSAWIYDRVE